METPEVPRPSTRRPDASTCLAVGHSTEPNPTAVLVSVVEGVVVPIINGTPGEAQIVARTSGLDGVDCAGASTCEAVGDDGPD